MTASNIDTVGLRDLFNMVLALVLGIYIFYKNPQSKINLSFFLFSLTVVLLDFAGYNFSVARTYGVAYFWTLFYATYHWSAVAQYLFMLAMTETWSQVMSKKSLYLVYVPAAVLTVMYLVGLAYFPNIKQIDGIWIVTQGSSIVTISADTIMGIWTLLMYGWLVVMGVRFFRSTFDPLKKSQIKIIGVAFFLTMILDTVQSVQWFGGVEIPTSIISGMTLFTAVVAYAMVKYDFMAINASSAAESIFATMNDGVFLLSTDYRIRLVNGAALRMVGELREEVIGRPVDEFFDMSDAPLLSKQLTKQLKKKTEVSDIEALLLHQQGEEAMPVSLSAAFITSRGSQERGIVCIVRDIFERKIQEERTRSSYQSIKLADQQIRVEIAKLHATFSSISEGLILVDVQGNIAMANPTAEAMLGWREDSMLGKNFYSSFRLTTEKGDEIPFQSQVEQALKKKSVLHFSMSDSVHLAGRSKRIPVSLTTSSVTLGTEVVGTITIFENITREMEVDKAKSEFVSLAAHQLRAPLTAILWNLEALGGDTFKKEQQELLTTAYRQAGGMSDLVSQFLNVSRLELGKLTVVPEPLDLVETLKDVINEQKMTYEKKKQKLVLKLAKDLPTIPLDKVLIRIVLQNLLSNAIKYTPEKGTVSVTLEKGTTSFKFIVKDTGIGIAKEQQPMIFDKLFRATNALTSGEEGNGLGLYIVKSIVKIAKGEIKVDSELGKGTTFTVRIPYTGMEKKEGTRGLVEVKGRTG